MFFMKAKIVAAALVIAVLLAAALPDMMKEYKRAAACTVQVTAVLDPDYRLPPCADRSTDVGRGAYDKVIYKKEKGKDDLTVEICAGQYRAARERHYAAWSLTQNGHR